MAIDTSNSNSLPCTNTGLVVQYTEPPTSIPNDGIFRGTKGHTTEYISNVPQVIGLVPLFPCDSDDCRYGLYTADIIADDRDFILPVYGDQTDAATYKNDINSWLISFPANYNAITSGAFILQKKVNGTWTDADTLDDTTYGIPYSNNFCGSPMTSSTCTNFNYQGYKIEWRKVLAALGEGTYRFKVSGSYAPHYPFCDVSPPFCAAAWSCHGVDGTVKFEATYNGGRFGSVNKQGTDWSLCCNCQTTIPGSSVIRSATFGIQWQDSIRFFGFFGYETADYQRDSIKYQTGVIKKVRDEAIKNFSFRSDKLPLWLHQRFYAYGLMADYLYVNDYNINNADYNLKHFYIVADGNYAPKYNTWSRYMKAIDIKFREGQQYVFRDRCCSSPLPLPIGT